MGQEYIIIGNMQFRPLSFVDMQKAQFVTYYAGKLDLVDINDAWDIIQDHIRGALPNKDAKLHLHNKSNSVKVKKK